MFGVNWARAMPASVHLGHDIPIPKWVSANGAPPRPDDPNRGQRPGGWSIQRGTAGPSGPGSRYSAWVELDEISTTRLQGRTALQGRPGPRRAPPCPQSRSRRSPLPGRTPPRGSASPPGRDGPRQHSPLRALDRGRGNRNDRGRWAISLLPLALQTVDATASSGSASRVAGHGTPSTAPWMSWREADRCRCLRYLRPLRRPIRCLLLNPNHLR